MAESVIPNSPRGRAFMRMLTVLWYAAVIGVAFQVHFFVWAGLSLAVGGHAPRPWDGVFHGVSLIAWSVLGWIAYRGRRQGHKPAEWVMMSMALLVWVVLGTTFLAIRA